MEYMELQQLCMPQKVQAIIEAIVLLPGIVLVAELKISSLHHWYMRVRPLNE